MQRSNIKLLLLAGLIIAGLLLAACAPAPAQAPAAQEEAAAQEETAEEPAARHSLITLRDLEILEQRLSGRNAASQLQTATTQAVTANTVTA